MASKVYFTDMRALPGTNLQKKLEKLMRRAGIETIDFQDKFAAIKIHFGEPGNLSYLRPNFAKTVADVVKSLGGKPFLTDCNTLYVGRRKNALDHLEAAYENGFSPFSTGCHVIIADGLKGTDEVEVPVEGGEYVKSAKIGRAIMDADVYIALCSIFWKGEIETSIRILHLGDFSFFDFSPCTVLNGIRLPCLVLDSAGDHLVVQTHRLT